MAGQTQHVGRPDTGLTEAEVQALRDADSYVEAAPAFFPRVAAQIAAARTLATSLTTAQAAAIMGVSEGWVRQRINQHTLLAQKLTGGYRLPAFQFAGGAELPEWSRIAPLLPAEITMRAAEKVMTTPNPELEIEGEPRSLADWLLAAGDIEVLQEFVEHAFRTAV